MFCGYSCTILCLSLITVSLKKSVRESEEKVQKMKAVALKAKKELDLHKKQVRLQLSWPQFLSRLHKKKQDIASFPVTLI